MWFEGHQQWFTLNYNRVIEVQKENAKIIIESLKPILEKETKKLQDDI
jgi:hypothetical protein